MFIVSVLGVGYRKEYMYINENDSSAMAELPYNRYTYLLQYTCFRYLQSNYCSSLQSVVFHIGAELIIISGAGGQMSRGSSKKRSIVHYDAGTHIDNGKMSLHVYSHRKHCIQIDVFFEVTMYYLTKYKSILTGLLILLFRILVQ